MNLKTILSACLLLSLNLSASEVLIKTKACPEKNNQGFIKSLTLTLTKEVLTVERENGVAAIQSGDRPVDTFQLKVVDIKRTIFGAYKVRFINHEGGQEVIDERKITSSSISDSDADLKSSNCK